MLCGYQVLNRLRGVAPLDKRCPASPVPQDFAERKFPKCISLYLKISSRYGISFFFFRNFHGNAIGIYIFIVKCFCYFPMFGGPEQLCRRRVLSETFGKTRYLGGFNYALLPSPSSLTVLSSCQRMLSIHDPPPPPFPHDDMTKLPIPNG